MDWLNKILGIKTKGEFEIVYSKGLKWVIAGSSGEYNEYCVVNILHNPVTNVYKFKASGYKPENHSAYQTIFKWYRGLVDGTLYVKGGEIYEITPSNTNGKDVSSMNETECQVYLNKAIEEENYELADKIRKQLEKFR